MFDTHELNDRGRSKSDKIRDVFRGALAELELLCAGAPQPGDLNRPPFNNGLQIPNGRELALLRTHLEMASFYAMRAMVLCPENQAGRES